MSRSVPIRSSIRSKVTAALLAVALVPATIVGLVAHQLARDDAVGQVTDRLAGIAAVQEERVNAYALSSLENLALVASRTQLRLSFAAELDEPAEANVALMQRIMGDAVASSSIARRIELVDLDGRVVASSDGTDLGADRSDQPAFVRGRSGPDLSQVTERDGERLAVHGGPVALDGEQLGVVLVEASLDPLDRLMTDYTGLGDSGETVLGRFDDQMVQLLGRIRFPDELAGDAEIGSGLFDAALTEREGEVITDQDYRGRDVFAVGRRIDAVPGWALVVKTDQSEALAGANRIRNLLLLAFALLTLGVLAASWFLARALTRPVFELHDAAVAVAGGETERRAAITSGDELADLAVQFNRMTDELTAANARLRLTNEQLEEFVYISSHDLKSPLRSISSFGQLLQAKYGPQFDEEGVEYLGYIRDGAARMHTVVEDLLDYLRIEKAGHTVVPVDLGQLFDDIAVLHGPELTEAEAELRRGDLPTVEGSAALLRQLFDNLIQNAIRYRRPDRPLLVEVTAERRADRWEIGLADNGIGVPADRREDAFTVFKRLSDTGDGTGMGLAICRRIARRHGGDVVMADSPHGGAKVVVTLAVAPVTGADDANRTPAESAARLSV